MKAVIRFIFRYAVSRKKPAIFILMLATRAFRRLLREEERTGKSKPIYPVF